MGTKPKIQRYRRTVDPAGTDPGAAREIENLASRKKALAGLEPSTPRLGNPVAQISGAARAVARKVTPRTEHTPAEEESFKQRGQRAFYEGKIEKAQRYIPKTSVGSLARKGRKP